jgi:hypothetical protein
LRPLRRPFCFATISPQLASTRANPRLFRDQAEVTFTPRIFNHTLIDGLAFLISIPFFELVESGQEAGVIPVLFWLY